MTDHTAQGRIMKISVKKKEYIFYSVILIVSILFFTFVGERGYYEYPDSWQYVTISMGQGIMPAYPLFIHAHRLLLGEDAFLYGVVVSQTVLSIGSLMLFVFWIRKRFKPGFIVSGLVAVVFFVPYTLDLPEVLINHSILTEALTYPLFSLFVIAFTETAIRKQYRWFFFTVIMAEVMAMIRTQMQICFIFVAAVLVFLVWSRHVGEALGKRILTMILSFLAGLVVVVVAEVVLLNINGRLQAKARMISYSLEAEKAVDDAQPEGEESAQSQQEEIIGDSTNITDQFISVLLNRGLYEMNEVDALLFEDDEIRQVFMAFYKAAEASGARYVYAKEGLWKWKDIMNGIAGGTYTMLDGWEEFQRENPESDLNRNWQKATNVIAFTLLKEHWPRMLYHTLCILPQGFICTVFFQIKEIYGLCHIYTFLVYLAAVIFTAIGFFKKASGFSAERSEFMLGMLVINIGMVVIISVIFFGMQRYLIYGFGTFYAALLLMLEEIWKLYGSTLWKKLRSRS